ncbi:uncharacterized protein [Amphiura filiformis]|uniref:uncharacterized protein isoform X1 n=1 Tax=Amphiura filiformis TaxID=82378 RepID=UPI003B21BD3C
MASTPEPCADGRYRDRPARDLKEWREWQTIFSTSYDFSKPVRPQKSPKRRKKSAWMFTQHQQYRWTCQRQEWSSPQDAAVAGTIKGRLMTKQENGRQSDQDRFENSDFQVYIKTPISTTENLKVNQSTTVIEIKTVIGDKLGIATDKLELYTGHMKMCNLLTLGDHGVKNQSNLEMKILPGLLGGSDRPQDSSADGKRKSNNTNAAGSTQEENASGSEAMSQLASMQHVDEEVDWSDSNETLSQSENSSESLSDLPVNYKKDTSDTSDSDSVCFDDTHNSQTLPQSAVSSDDSKNGDKAGADVTPESTSQSAPSPDNNDRGDNPDSTEAAEASPQSADSPDNIDRSEFADFTEVTKALKKIMKKVDFVQKTFEQWHHVAKTIIGQCEHESGYCSNEFLWSHAIKEAKNNYAPGNRELNSYLLESSIFCSDPFEIAKLFIFKPPGDRLDKCTSFDKLDPGAILLIMMNFAPFLVTREKRESVQQQILDEHSKSSKASREVGMRLNQLGHQPKDKDVERKLHVEQMGNIINKVYVNSRCDLAHLPASEEITFKELKERVKEIKSLVDLMKDLQYFKKEEANTMKDELEADLLYDEDSWRTQLMEEYRINRSKVPLLPGMPEECANMDNLYIELDILKEEKKPTAVEETKLKSPSELLALKDKTDKYVKRILVRGRPGSGKSVTISKLAYDWANEKEHFSQSKLVFALDIREIESGMNLIDAVQDQLLPKVSKEKLQSYIEANPNSVTFLLDGFDEAPNVLVEGDIKHLLSSKWLAESLVIVTSRPHKVAQFVDAYGVYLHIKLHGFSGKKLKQYVLRFFQVPYISKYIKCVEKIGSEKVHFIEKPLDYFIYPEYTGVNSESDEDSQGFYGMIPIDDEFCLTLNETAAFLNKLTSSFNDLCFVPLIISMLCILRDELLKNDADADVLSQRVTSIYEEVVLHLAQHKQVKFQNEELNTDLLDDILCEVGKVALDGLFKNKLIFNVKDFDAKDLESALQIGILSKERKRSKLRAIHQVSFFHKTLQEYCAAIYWASLFESDQESAMAYLRKIDDRNLKDFERLLQFCCGKRIKAAEQILDHVVRLACDRIVSMPCHDTDCENRFGNCSKFGFCLPWWEFALLLLDESGAQDSLYTHLLPLFDWQALFQTSVLYIQECVELLCGQTISSIRERRENEDFISGESRKSRKSISEHMERFLDCILSCQITVENSIYKGITKVILSGYFLSSSICLKHLSCIAEVKCLVIYNENIDALCSHQMTNIRQIRCLQFGDNVSHMKDKGSSRGSSVSIPNVLTLIQQLPSLSSFTWYETHGLTQILRALAGYTLTELEVTTNRVNADLLNPFIYTLEKLGLSYDERCVDEASDIEEELAVDTSVKQNECEKLFTLFVDVGAKLAASHPSSGNVTDTPMLPCKHLALTNLDISNSTACKLIEAFKYLGNLVELSVCWTHLSEEAQVKIIVNFPNSLPLEKMNFSRSTFGKGGSLLSEKLKCYPKLQELDLCYNDIDGPGMTLIVQNLCHLSNMNYLMLSGNDIGSGDVDLSCALTPLTKLIKLELAKTNLTQANVKQIGNCLVHMPELVKLDLGCNQAVGTAMPDLCSGLQSLTKLRELDLNNTGITDDGIQIPLDYLIGLRSLDLHGESQKYGPKGLEHVLRNCDRLKSLHINWSEFWNNSHQFLEEFSALYYLPCHSFNDEYPVSSVHITTYAYKGKIQSRYCFYRK